MRHVKNGILLKKVHLQGFVNDPTICFINKILLVHSFMSTYYLEWENGK